MSQTFRAFLYLYLSQTYQAADCSLCVPISHSRGNLLPACNLRPVLGRNKSRLISLGDQLCERDIREILFLLFLWEATREWCTLSRWICIIRKYYKLIENVFNQSKIAWKSKEPYWRDIKCIFYERLNNMTNVKLYIRNEMCEYLSVDGHTFNHNIVYLLNCACIAIHEMLLWVITVTDCRLRTNHTRSDFNTFIFASYSSDISLSTHSDNI